MASYTTNLNLLKKDPVADGSDTFNIQTMLNDNWDKIDANAAEVDAALDSKAVVRYTAYTNLNDLLTVPSGFYNIAPPATGMPMSGYWYCIVCAEQPNIGTRIIYAMPVGIGNDSLWKIRCTGGVPETWKEMATTTPPTEYDLPLASGVTANGRCVYFKAQDGVVTICGSVSTSLSAGISALLAVLPVGFRPSDNLYFPMTTNSGAGQFSVYTNGSVQAASVFDSLYLFINVSFVAGN